MQYHYTPIGMTEIQKMAYHLLAKMWRNKLSYAASGKQFGSFIKS